MSQIDPHSLNFHISQKSKDNEESIVLTQLTFCSMIKSLAKPRGIHTFSSDLVIFSRLLLNVGIMYCVCMRGILREPTILFPINWLGRLGERLKNPMMHPLKVDTTRTFPQRKRPFIQLAWYYGKTRAMGIWTQNHKPGRPTVIFKVVGVL